MDSDYGYELDDEAYEAHHAMQLEDAAEIAKLESLLDALRVSGGNPVANEAAARKARAQLAALGA